MYENVKKYKNTLTLKEQEGIVLDIDETLCKIVNYWISKMQSIFGNPEQLSTEEITSKYRYAHLVPYWNTKDALEWMESARISNELQLEFELIEKSRIYIKKIQSFVPIVGYITARNECVKEGTIQWLTKNKLPKHPIIFRPDNIKHADSYKWKAEVLEYLYPNVLGIIDDSPEVVSNLSATYQGVIFLYNGVTTGVTGNKIVICSDWKDTYKKVCLHFNNRNIS